MQKSPVSPFLRRSPISSTTGDGDPFASAAKVFREWGSIASIDRGLRQQVLEEAVDFARQRPAE